MLKNFQLAAIAKDGSKTLLLGIPLHQKLQNMLADSWQTQYEDFVGSAQQIDFNAGYTPEKHERFCIKDYKLPDWIGGETSQTAANIESINAHEKLVGSIKSIVAFARDDEDGELILFQSFNRSNVIRPGHYLLLKQGTYESAEGAALTLEAKLSAAYVCAQNKLLFYNFRTTNTFLPLSDFYEEATEQEIRELLTHDSLAPEDSEVLAANANQWFRKRFAILKNSGILDKYSVRQIKAHSKDYDVEIHIKDGKIVFPADRAAAKRLLQFLNEELFRGAITETLYEVNSKREAD